MKVVTKLAVATLGIVVISCSVGVYRIYQSQPHELHTETPIVAYPEVQVNINKDTDIPIEYEIVEDENGEEVIAQVQENAPQSARPSEPPQKPIANGDYSNPDKPPVYTEQQTVVEQKPTQQSGSRTGNKVYIDGFGYVQLGSGTTTQTGSSTGDINKIVGSMD